MSRNKKNRLLYFILPIPIILLIYFTVCTFLYFFEPIAYQAPDLSLSTFSFDLYKKFDYSRNSNFYIKQVRFNDIVSVDEDKRLKYVNDTILLIAEDDTKSDDITTLMSDYKGEIVGFIDAIDFYQITVADSTYDELQNICLQLIDNDMVKYAMVDYFEESPVAETSTELSENVYSDFYYYDMINIYDAWELSEGITDSISVGVFDVPVYSDHEQLNVVNKHEYSNDLLDNELISTSASHGTHVAGIISADANSETCGVCQNAVIYSDNAINNSISYWIAAITNMIVNNNVKAINISMGYNSYIPVSASLGCESTIKYIKNENEFFEAFLANLIEDGYEFLICVSAGNESGTTLYKTNSPFFSYGDKEMLKKLDFLGLFDKKPEYCSAEYQLCLTAIDDPAVRDRIMIVASCDYFMNISDFSTLGEAVDIVAPGEGIYSTGYTYSHEYMSGTSMAAPFVTGSAALLFSIDESLTGAQVKNILINTASDYVSTACFNYPLLNIGKAVEYVVNN